MNQTLTIAIIGGGGRTGKFLVAQLLREDYHLKVLVRNPERILSHSPQLKTILGDATDQYIVNELLKNCQAVINLIGQRPGESPAHVSATQNILTAMRDQNITRYILVAGINVDVPSDEKGELTLAATRYMQTNFAEVHAARQHVYSNLLECTVAWTLVRVPLIEFREDVLPTFINTKDCLGNKITAGSIAQFISEQLWDTRYYREAPFIFNA